MYNNIFCTYLTFCMCDLVETALVDWDSECDLSDQPTDAVASPPQPAPAEDEGSTDADNS